MHLPQMGAPPWAWAQTAYACPWRGILRPWASFGPVGEASSSGGCERTD